MKKTFHAVAFLSGVVFAIGLGISGMTQSSKVVGFLDVFGDWDPSLMFVMIGAIAVHMLTYRLIRKRPSPLFASQFQWPRAQQIDKRLIAGSAIFGIGWGLAGYCPGPALTALPAGGVDLAAFVGAMLTGILTVKALTKLQASRSEKRDVQMFKERVTS